MQNDPSVVPENDKRSISEIVAEYFVDVNRVQSEEAITRDKKPIFRKSSLPGCKIEEGCYVFSHMVNGRVVHNLLKIVNERVFETIRPGFSAGEEISRGDFLRLLYSHQGGKLRKSRKTMKRRNTRRHRTKGR
jgi:hypothetical protein